ncbi:MAG: ABC-type transport auxiliary lipoprotein family protein [Pseudomonadota bacterium]
MTRSGALLVSGLVSVLAGCALLPSGSAARREHVYVIAPEQTMDVRMAQSRCGTVQVAAGSAVVGHRGAAMMYSLDDIELKYFAYSRWGAPPTRMLRDQLRRFLRDSGAFDGVLDSPTVARTRYQLELTDTEVIQRFEGEASRVDMAFELRIFDGDRRRLLGSRRFVTDVSAGGDPASGAVAANAAARQLLGGAVDYVLELCRDPAPVEGT